MEDKRRTELEETIAYYDLNAEEFVNSTINADASELYKPFGELLSSGAKILDLGCGSGRDSRYFAQRGYDVVAVDPSLAMCEYTRSILDIPVFQMKAEDMDFQNEFDAVWACASLFSSSDGAGWGEVLIDQFLSDEYQIVKKGCKQPEIFHLVSLFEENVAGDRVSDMIATIIEPDIKNIHCVLCQSME